MFFKTNWDLNYIFTLKANCELKNTKFNSEYIFHWVELRTMKCTNQTTETPGNIILGLLSAGIRMVVPEINGPRYSRRDQVKFVEGSLRPCHFKIFKSCLPQILLDPFLNTLTQISILHLNSLNCNRNFHNFAKFCEITLCTHYYLNKASVRNIPLWCL